ncbi:hypothetical protein [Parendozoicomonas haliclonae]|uniref:Uncharacterized protein n=1 Tax=Parendozoicomonas haliclonae TaxID=1960125 RepID=A0A1X7AS24_9GAMM|nr:hypothetical protein [Parendozoicomonas haliclonae]SMA50942.1 hypothetical protein EHSB41UT_04760 [Parendozoicomonas haliclonae]
MILESIKSPIPDTWFYNQIDVIARWAEIASKTYKEEGNIKLSREIVQEVNSLINNVKLTQDRETDDKSNPYYWLNTWKMHSLFRAINLSERFVFRHPVLSDKEKSRINSEIMEEVRLLNNYLNHFDPFSTFTDT